MWLAAGLRGEATSGNLKANAHTSTIQSRPRLRPEIDHERRSQFRAPLLRARPTAPLSSDIDSDIRAAQARSRDAGRGRTGVKGRAVAVAGMLHRSTFTAAGTPDSDASCAGSSESRGVHDHRPRSPFSRPALSGRVPSRAGDSEVGKEGARSTELRAQYGAARAVGGSAVRIRSRSWPRCDRAATWGLGLPQKPPQVARCVLRPARMSSRTGKCLSFVVGAYPHSPLHSAAPAARSRTALMLHYPRALTCA